MEFTALAQIYGNAVVDKTRTLDSVPSAFRDEVQSYVEDRTNNSKK